MKIVADDKIPFLKGVLEPFADVVYMPGKAIGNQALHDADALLVRTRTRCNSTTLDNTRVKFIGTATIGYDHIDTRWCESHGIHWTNAPGCNSSSVMQYLLSALFTISAHDGSELKGKTLGIVGVGNVGSKVEKAARLLGMNVLLNDPPRERKEGPGSFTKLETLVGSSDIITVHVPLNNEGRDATYRFFGKQLFGIMKAGAWFINSSRGEVADQDVLKETLSSGKIRGAVLDVWENEPGIDIGLMKMCLLSTPHIAGYSTDGKANGTAMAVNALAGHFGLPLRNWYPAALPAPAKADIEIDCTGKSGEEILRQCVFQTYEVASDSERLRASPSDFENLRGSYPVRREFGAYRVKLLNDTHNTADILSKLGFGK